MTDKHPECDYRCQISVHKGYPPCEGECAMSIDNSKESAPPDAQPLQAELEARGFDGLPDAQPTPRTHALRDGIVARRNLRGFTVPEDIEDALRLAGDLESALAQKEAELAAANAQLENERMKVAGCSTAAFGYWKEVDSVHPDYDCAALHDVAQLYTKYESERRTRETVEQRLAVVESKLDAVMMEHCPDDMTPEQIANWAAHQRPATSDETAAIEAALTTPKGKS